MKERRSNRLGDEFRDLIAKYLEQASDRTSMITVTRVELLHSGKLVRAYLSVFPVEKEGAALFFAERNLSEIKAYLAKATKMRSVPSIEFVTDEGEKNRQRIDELSRK